MATKTISIDVEAYARLKSIQKPDESLSQAIKRVVHEPIDLDDLFRNVSNLSDAAVKAIEERVAQRH